MRLAPRDRTPARHAAASCRSASMAAGYTRWFPFSADGIDYAANFSFCRPRDGRSAAGYAAADHLDRVDNFIKPLLVDIAGLQRRFFEGQSFVVGQMGDLGGLV